MKLHPALLGLGLIVAAGLACNFSVGNVNSNSGGASNTSASNSSNASETAGGVRVEELYAAKFGTTTTVTGVPRGGMLAGGRRRPSSPGGRGAPNCPRYGRPSPTPTIRADPTAPFAMRSRSIRR